MRHRRVPVALAVTTAACLVVAVTARGSGNAIEPGVVDFPHEQHYDDLEIECAVCHHETKAAKLTIPHEEYFADFWDHCTSCHGGAEETGAPRSCGSCHHDSPVDVADETLSAKVVVHRTCWGCHEVGTGRSASQACKNCHPAGNAAAGPEAGASGGRTEGEPR